MMTNILKRDARTRALPAIAAALALFSTPVLAQQQQPGTTDASTTAAAAPAAKPQPIIDLGKAKPAAAPKAAAATPLRERLDDPTIQAAGGALVLLLIAGGIALALIGRRRRRREQELADQQTLAYEPCETAVEPAPQSEPAVREEQPATAAASAFAWGDQPRAEAHDRDAGVDRHPGETWTERAYRGPSPENPSESLKTRLKRAAFFDKREMEAAAGMAEPVDAGAGLPEAMVEDDEREPA